MAEFKFRVLSPAESRRLWPDVIRPRLERTLRCAPCGAYPEDFYHELMDGSFSSITLELHGKIVGILVVEEITRRLTKDTGLFVWAAEADASAGALSFIAQLVDAMAEQYEYDFVQFSSSRRQWQAMQRRGRYEGWHEHAVIWEKEYERR